MRSTPSVKKYYDEQNRFVDSKLKEVKKLKDKGDLKHVIAFSHIPPFIYDPDEEPEYFNWSLDERKGMLDKLSHAGCRYWFCGHFHDNAGGK